MEEITNVCVCACPPPPMFSLGSQGELNGEREKISDSKIDSRREKEGERKRDAHACHVHFYPEMYISSYMEIFIMCVCVCVPSIEGCSNTDWVIDDFLSVWLQGSTERSRQGESNWMGFPSTSCSV